MCCFQMTKTDQTQVQTNTQMRNDGWPESEAVHELEDRPEHGIMRHSHTNLWMHLQLENRRRLKKDTSKNKKNLRTVERKPIFFVGQRGELGNMAM